MVSTMNTSNGKALAAGIIIIKLIGFVFLLSGNGIYN